MIYLPKSKLHILFQAFLAFLLFLNPKHTSPLLVNRTPFPIIFKKVVLYLRCFPLISLSLVNLLLPFFRKLYLFLLSFSSQYRFFLSYLIDKNYCFVFSAPYIFPNTNSLPLQLACSYLKIPLVGQIASWDNLTTKEPGL